MLPRCRLERLLANLRRCLFFHKGLDLCTSKEASPFVCAPTDWPMRHFARKIGARLDLLPSADDCRYPAGTRSSMNNNGRCFRPAWRPGSNHMKRLQISILLICFEASRKPEL